MMQAYDAEFYPVKEGRKKQWLIRAAIGGFILLLLTLLIVRVSAWSAKRQETELLVLVNEWNSVDASGFRPRLRETENGLKADKRCVKELEKMLSDCRRAGHEPRLISGYRSRKEQEELFEKEKEHFLAMGESPAEAERLSLMTWARPGCSEHELGLAFDIADGSVSGKESFQEDSPALRWLRENCWKYGFILRYPEKDIETTGISYKPAHYRYVGPEAAELITELDICLEDYIKMFYSEQAVVIEEK